MNVSAKGLLRGGALLSWGTVGSLKIGVEPRLNGAPSQLTGILRGTTERKPVRETLVGTKTGFVRGTLTSRAKRKVGGWARGEVAESVRTVSDRTVVE